MAGRHDVIVVGAGPAGAATACTLAREGARVLLLDRERFPRDKACGGGLTPRGAAALARIGVKTSGHSFLEVGGLEMVGAGRSSAVAFPATSRFAPVGLVARRIDLDAEILGLALDAGCEMVNARVLGPVMEDGICRGVRMQDSGARVEYLGDFVIGADGATSSIARGAGLAPSGASHGGFWYAAMRGYFSPVAPRSIAAGPLIEFYPLRTPDGRWLPGYGWVFPLPGGAANVGVDLPHKPPLAGSPALRSAYDAFVARLRRERPGFEDAQQEAPPVGALLPEGMSGVTPARSGVLLVGDAAGLITPYSGEGIVYALESAELAADALRAERPSAVADRYRASLRDSFGFHFRMALLFMKGVRRPPLARLAAATAIGRPRVLRGAVRVMAHLIEDDPDAPPSTVSRAYRGAKRVIGP